MNLSRGIPLGEKMTDNFGTENEERRGQRVSLPKSTSRMEEVERTTVEHDGKRDRGDALFDPLKPNRGRSRSILEP